MCSLIRGLVIILIIRSSTANLLSIVSGTLSFATEDVSSNDCFYPTKISDDGILDMNSLAQKLNSNVNLTRILNLLNVNVTNGLIDLKKLAQNFNLSKVKLVDILTAIKPNISNEILDFACFAKNITNDVHLTNHLNSVTVDTEDALLDFTGLAKKYIGAVEEYTVITEDGYNLTLYHIPGNLGNASNVVLLSHGFLSSSDDFMIRGRTSLVYRLVQNGSDVWVLNYRGSRYSRRHVTLNPDTDAKYWNFSMQELGYFDLSAIIDFVLNKTKHQKLSIVGHSEGTAAAFILLSLKPEFNGKIKIFIALSPVCYLSYGGIALESINHLWPVSNELFKASGINEFLGYDNPFRQLLKHVCFQGSVGYDFCVKVGVGLLAGYDPDNLEPEFLKTVLGHYPSGTSTKNLIHYNQIGVNNIFAQYDYGTKNNKEIYGSVHPPKYNFENVICNVVLFVARNDKILGIKDAEKVRDQLPNVKCYIVNDSAFNHFDFTYARNAHKILYPLVIDLLNEYIAC